MSTGRQMHTFSGCFDCDFRAQPCSPSHIDWSVMDYDIILVMDKGKCAKFMFTNSWNRLGKKAQQHSIPSLDNDGRVDMNYTDTIH